MAQADPEFDSKLFKALVRHYVECGYDANGIVDEMGPHLGPCGIPAEAALERISEITKEAELELYDHPVPRDEFFGKPVGKEEI